LRERVWDAIAAGYLGRDALARRADTARRGPVPVGGFRSPSSSCFSTAALLFFRLSPHKAASNADSSARFRKAAAAPGLPSRMPVLSDISRETCSTAAVASGTICAVRWRAPHPSARHPGPRLPSSIRVARAGQPALGRHLGRRHFVDALDGNRHERCILTPMEAQCRPLQTIPELWTER